MGIRFGRGFRDQNEAALRTSTSCSPPIELRDGWGSRRRDDLYPVALASAPHFLSGLYFLSKAARFGTGLTHAGGRDKRRRVFVGSPIVTTASQRRAVRLRASGPQR